MVAIDRVGRLISLIVNKIKYKVEVIDQLMRAVMAGGSSSGVSALSRRREKEEDRPGRQQLVSLVSLLFMPSRS